MKVMAATGVLALAATATVIVLPADDTPTEPPGTVAALTPPDPDPVVQAAPVALVGVARAATVPARPVAVRMTAMANWRRGQWQRWTPRVERFARCVARHESWHAGLWRAENPVSTASGAFQMIDSTYRAYARRAHVPNRGHASRATPREQARIMAWAWFHHHQRAWHGTHCAGT